MPTHGLIESSRFHAVKDSQIDIQHDPLASNEEYTSLNITVLGHPIHD